MNFYSFDEIRAAGSCIQFVEQILGLTVRNGRVPAEWRGGDGPNVAVSDNEWYDHVAKKGGGILELAMESKFDGDIQAAQNMLGEWLGLTPKNTVTKRTTRYDELLSLGYKETHRYNYTDLDGSLVHFVARMEHPTRDKEFLQGTPKGWGLRGINPILYRLRDWSDSKWVCVVEGEKDADTLADLGIPATTGCGGAEKWKPEYATYFTGKRVAIILDNDEAGEKHALTVASALKHSAKNLYILCPSKLPKGDVTDFLEREGGTKEQLMDMLKDAQELLGDALPEMDPAIQLAKAANKRSLANFTEHQEQLGAQTKKVRTPRVINSIIEDVHTRFLGFPRRIGGSRFLFDHDRDSHQIVHIHDAAELFAWLGRKSKLSVPWAIGDAMVTKSEIFKGLAAEAITYEAISTVPDWPRRKDVYYAHPPLPEPSPGFQYFRDLVDFFAPASPEYKTMLKAFICAPLWYMRGIPRPGWVIDSEDGAGTGKTTMVELIAMLYGGSPVRTNKQELRTDVSEIVKRLVSTEGRLARILLADNITGDFHCAELSDFMTAADISGKAPYGRGEETRPNNLTYVITANSATVDNDLSDRCYFVHVRRPRRAVHWKREIMEYINQHRMHIIADIIGMLSSNNHTDLEPATRFPEFEQTILRGVCDTDEEYHAAIGILEESRASSNIEDEHARTIEDEFSSRLSDAGRYPDNEWIFVRAEVVKYWIDEILNREIQGSAMQYLRNLAKNGLTKCFLVRPERYPNNGPKRRRGIMWKPANPSSDTVRIIGLKNRKITEIM